MNLKVNDPREKLKAEIAKAERRLMMLSVEERRLKEVQGLFEFDHPLLPEHIEIELDLQAQLGWREDQEHVELEIQLTQVRNWEEVQPLFVALEQLGYEMEVWNSSDNPKYMQRTYTWKTGYEHPFGIRIEVTLDEANTECKKVLVRVEHHTASSYTEEIYAFDCGEGAEETIRRANEEKLAA